MAKLPELPAGPGTAEPPAVPTQAVKLGRPDPTAVEAARKKAAAAAAQRHISPGTVIDLPEGWHSYVLDLAHDQGRLEHLRAKLAAKGYTKAPDLRVAGIASPEVWVIPSVVHAEFVVEPRQARDDARRKQWRQRQTSV